MAILRDAVDTMKKSFQHGVLSHGDSGNQGWKEFLLLPSSLPVTSSKTFLTAAPALWTLHDQRSHSGGCTLARGSGKQPVDRELQLLPVCFGFFVLRHQKVRGGVTILTREGVTADTQEGGKESMWNLGALLGVLDSSCPTVCKMEQHWPERAIVTRGLTVLQAEGTGLYHQVNRRDQQV